MTVPDRGMDDSLLDTLSDTIPLPVRVPDGLTAIQDALLTAVHEQFAPVVTVNDGAGLPFLFTFALDGLSEYVQVGAAAAWLTVNVCP